MSLRSHTWVVAFASLSPGHNLSRLHSRCHLRMSSHMGAFDACCIHVWHYSVACVCHVVCWMEVLPLAPLWLAFQGRALLMGEPISSRDDGVTCLVWLPWPVCSLPHVGSFSRLRLRPWSGQGVAPAAPRAPAARPAGRRVLALPCLSPAWIGVEGTSFSRVRAQQAQREGLLVLVGADPYLSLGPHMLR